MERISVLDPIGLAEEKVRRLLFNPFDLGKWFTIGFCAWLAMLGERGFRANFNYGSGPDNHGSDMHQQVEHAHAYIRENLNWILPLSIAAIIIVLALWLLFLWLNSRGKFMFLYCVALERAEVREPWNRFANAANSLFRFRLVLGLLGFVIMLPLIFLFAFSAFSMFLRNSWNFAGILAMIGLFLTMIVIGIFLLVIRKLTTDFVVPMMFLRGNRCVEAWREFGKLLGAHAGEFVLYILFQIVISLVIGAITLTVVLLTCCIAGCLLLIPYVGTVLFLPVLVFTRAYSLYYLAQFGPAYNVFPAGG